MLLHRDQRPLWAGLSQPPDTIIHGWSGCISKVLPGQMAAPGNAATENVQQVFLCSLFSESFSGTGYHLTPNIHGWRGCTSQLLSGNLVAAWKCSREHERLCRLALGSWNSPFALGADFCVSTSDGNQRGSYAIQNTATTHCVLGTARGLCVVLCCVASGLATQLRRWR